MSRPNPSGSTQQSPLLNKNTGSSPQRHEMKEQPAPSQHSHPPWLYVIVVDLINLLMTAAEIGLVLYLTVHHIEESQGVIAVAMLAPILLNFVGVTYFFSDPNERREFEKVGTTRLTKDLFQVPVLGPVFTAFKVLLISSGLSKNKDIEYERFEASAVKMRQAQTFFSASPEAVVQLSVLLVSQGTTITLTHILEILVVVVSIFTLAESNVYALRSNYFRLFKNYREGDWTVHASFGHKVILFLHSFCSIASRVAAAACLIAGIQCFSMRGNAARAMHQMAMGHRRPMPTTTTTRRPHPWSNRNNGQVRPMMETEMAMMEEMPEAEGTNQLALVIALTLLALIIYHLVIYYVARLLRYSCMKTDTPSGCYESVNYGWRSTILHTGFQSKNIATQLWFYCENCAMFTLWWLSVQQFGNANLKRRTQIPMTIIFTLTMVLSIFFLFAAVGSGMHRLRSPFKQKREELPTSIS